MGEFFEPDKMRDGLISPPKVFTPAFLGDVVKRAIANGEIPPDHRFVLIGGVDEQGVKAVATVRIVNKEKFKLNFEGVAEHDWDGDNKIGARVIFSMK